MESLTLQDVKIDRSCIISVQNEPYHENRIISRHQLQECSRGPFDVHEHERCPPMHNASPGCAPPMRLLMSDSAGSGTYHIYRSPLP